MRPCLKPITLLIFLFVAFTACKKESQTMHEVSSFLDVIPIFTDEDAALSFERFHDTFFDDNTKLYFNNTNRDVIAQGWTQAVFFDMATNNYVRSQKQEDLQIIQQIYEGAYNAYSHFNWPEVKTVNDFIYDDMMWWIISLARTYQITQNQTYLAHAVAGFDFVWDESYDPIDGGMRWSWKVEGKNACINYPTVIAAMILYHITHETSYLDKAKNIYQWSYNNLFEQSTGRVADHKVGNNPPGFEDYTYNQGTCIGAATLLYQETGDHRYLNDAILAAEYTKNAMCNADGILPAEGDWNEQGVLKAIFAQYIKLLIAAGNETLYQDWILTNINLGWQNRDTTRNLTYRDYTVPCPTGMIQSYEASSIVAFMQLFSPSIP